MINFRDKFETLNSTLRSALVIGDFAKVCDIDAERRKLLSDLMQLPNQAEDIELLNFIESCSVENAQISADLEEALSLLSHQTSQTRKMMRAYGS